MSRYQKHTLLILFIIVFAIPIILWLQQIGSFTAYLDGSSPPGQLPYIFSKLAGMIALACIAWQIIITLSSQLHIITVRWLGYSHRVFGAVILLFAISHFLLFFTAVTLRQDAFALNLLLPDFRDFYHTHLTFGLLGLWLLCIVAVVGWLRSRKRIHWIDKLHRLYWLAVGFIYFHALAVGSESQTAAGFLFYLILGLIMISLGCWSLIKRWVARAVLL
jgi:predicted ferric reductase